MQLESNGHGGISRAHVVETIEDCLRQVQGLEIAYSKEYPSQAPPGVSANDLPIAAPLKRYIAGAYPKGLFTHQHLAIRQVLGGQNIIVSTRTSSGKSLIFTVPAFQSFLDDKSSTSLLIYPQKALANDQLSKLREMQQSVCGPEQNPLLISRYDGATPQLVRARVREQAQFVLTNPDMLHYALLQYHNKWARFFRNLHYVVLDEAHVYNGVFGSSVAYILRRLRCICQHYGSSPRFMSASATMYEPAAHLNRLTGLTFSEIGPSDDGSLQGRRKLWLLRSGAHHYQTGRQLTRMFVDRGLSCLTFCPTRVSAERLVADFGTADLGDERIRVYRAGLTSSEREQIETGMKTGQIKGVFSTSALELGIDVGALDVALCVGLPSTMMSLWQRAGRVGRAGKEGGDCLRCGGYAS